MTLVVCECSLPLCKGVVLSSPGGYFEEEHGNDEWGRRFPIYLCEKHRKILRTGLYLSLCDRCGGTHFIRLASMTRDESNLTRVLITKTCKKCGGKHATEYFTPQRFINKEEHHGG